MLYPDDRPPALANEGVSQAVVRTRRPPAPRRGQSLGGHQSPSYVRSTDLKRWFGCAAFESCMPILAQLLLKAQRSLRRAPWEPGSRSDFSNSCVVYSPRACPAHLSPTPLHASAACCRTVLKVEQPARKRRFRETTRADRCFRAAFSAVIVTSPRFRRRAADHVGSPRWVLWSRARVVGAPPKWCPQILSLPRLRLSARAARDRLVAIVFGAVLAGVFCQPREIPSRADSRTTRTATRRAGAEFIARSQEDAADARPPLSK